MGGGGRYLGTAIVLILAITAWVLGHMFPFFMVMKGAGLLRVDESEERMGLDVSHHGGAAYEATAGEVLGKGAKEDDALLTRCGATDSSVMFQHACTRGSKPVLSSGHLTLFCSILVVTGGKTAVLRSWIHAVWMPRWIGLVQCFPRHTY